LSSSASNVPVQRRKTFVIHGHGGILCRQPDALHPGKRKTRQRRKFTFSQFVEKVFSTNCEWKSAKAVFHSIHHIYCKNGFPSRFTGLESLFLRS